MTRSLFILATLIATVAVSTPAAQAGHRSFCYAGKRCGFDGEAHMIEALVLMEDAYNTRCHVTQRSLIGRARLEVISAVRKVCDRGARYELLNAYRDLTRFIVTYDACYLDSAAASVTNAIELSQVAYFDVHEPAVLHQTHIHSRPAVVHQPPVVHTSRRVIHHRHAYGYPGNAIRIGNPRSGFSLRIGF